MDGSDRTDELIGAMLERRAGGPAPDDLLDRTVAAAAARRQVGVRRARQRALPLVISGRVAIVAAIGLVAVGLVVGTAITGLLPVSSGPQSSRGAAGDVTAPPSATSAMPSSSPAVGTPGSAAPTQPATLAPDALAPDTLAVVTRGGDRLRVRSAPGVGLDSEKLEPLLASGTRLLILGGPIRADGYDWYEVVVEDEPDTMYGWVAASDEGVAWIRPIAADCRGGADALDVAELKPFDFLACYHAQEVSLDARWNEAQDGSDIECPWVNGVACDFDEGWLLQSVYVRYVADDGTRHTIGFAVPTAVRPSIQQVPGDATMHLTLAMDAPEARSCRITDPQTGLDLVPPNRVITACRLAFVVRAVSWDP